MDSAASRLAGEHVVSGAASELEVRVILVGRTGLDAKLRLDPGLELVRVRTSLEAIGELSDPIDEESPRACVVIFGEDGGEESDPLESVLKGLRMVDPAVGVVGLRGIGSRDTNADAEYDAMVPIDAPAELVRTVVRDVANLRRPRMSDGASAPAPTADAMPVAAPGPVPEPSFAVDDDTDPVITAATGGVTGDDALVAQLLHGRDITDAAVQLLRMRTGDPALQYTPGSALPTSVDLVGAAPVTWDGRVLGVLRSATTPEGQLRAHAVWLAGWLRLRDQQEQLREAAFTDSLTGAWNRRYFERFLRAAIDQARANRRSVTILFFDIDDFKKFNDNYGHEAGDEILTETVKLLRSVVRPTDRVCRIGGDEFAVVFNEPEGPRHSTSKHPTHVCQIAHRFQEQIRSHRFPKLSQEAPGPLTISGGLATYPWDGMTVEELLRRADELSLTCKRQGKNAIMLGPDVETGE